MWEEKLTSGRFDPAIKYSHEKYFTIYLPRRTELFTHMTRLPIASSSRRVPVRAAVVLLLVLAALLLAAGCTSPENSDAAAGTTATNTLSTISTRQVTPTFTPEITLTEPEPVPVTPTNTETKSSAGITIAQSGNYHSEYIKMDATLYKAGEVVQFYLVNKGPEITGCSFTHPAYTVYRELQDGTRQKIASDDPSRSYPMVIAKEEVASSTGPFTLDTARLIPGRYLIRFDCGNNVAREFILYAKSPAEVTWPCIVLTRPDLMKWSGLCTNILKKVYSAILITNS
jgi:hypothetical protein